MKNLIIFFFMLFALHHVSCQSLVYYYPSGEVVTAKNPVLVVTANGANWAFDAYDENGGYIRRDSVGLYEYGFEYVPEIECNSHILQVAEYDFYLEWLPTKCYIVAIYKHGVFIGLLHEYYTFEGSNPYTTDLAIRKLLLNN